MQSGSTISTTLAANSTAVFTPPNLPVGGIYNVVVSSDKPIMGVTTIKRMGQDFEIHGPLSSSLAPTLPRAFKHFASGSGAVTTRLALMNTSLATANTVTVNFTNASGSFTHTGISITAG